MKLQGMSKGLYLAAIGLEFTHPLTGEPLYWNYRGL
jgi:hypothetical protein